MSSVRPATKYKKKEQRYAEVVALHRQRALQQRAAAHFHVRSVKQTISVQFCHASGSFSFQFSERNNFGGFHIVALRWNPFLRVVGLAIGIAFQIRDFDMQRGRCLRVASRRDFRMHWNRRVVIQRDFGTRRNRRVAIRRDFDMQRGRGPRFAIRRDF